MKIRMEDVVIGLNLAPRIKGSAMDITCPNCGHDCLHFDFQRQVFACPICADHDQVKGGIIDAWAFFRGIQGSNIKETRSLAKKDIERFYGQTSIPTRTYNKKTDYKEPVQIASEEERNRFYRKFLSVMPLRNAHVENLKRRGLTDAQIKQSQIKSFKHLSTDELEDLFPNTDISPFPGFYMKYQKPRMVDYGSGMLIPEISVNGYIQGFQIRRDTGDKKKRYITLSSAKQGGAKGPTFVHYANCQGSTTETCIITEGPLKGTIINQFTKIPVLAVPGVSSQKYLNKALEELKTRGLKEVKIAFDMDFYDKKEVQKALASLRKKLSDLEIPYVQLRWIYTEETKGYDDYLLKKASE